MQTSRNTGKWYFDSSGNLKSPQKVVKHFGDDVKNIYNNDAYQHLVKQSVYILV